MNAATWFEIPAADLARAQRVYEAVLGATLRREQPGMGLFAHIDDSEGNLVGLHAMA